MAPINKKSSHFVHKFKKEKKPKVHQSTALPWPILNRISGARYSGVPQTDCESFPLVPSFESPKSVILI